MPQMQGNALEISLDFQFRPIPAIFLHTPLFVHMPNEEKFSFRRVEGQDIGSRPESMLKSILCYAVNSVLVLIPD